MGCLLLILLRACAAVDITFTVVPNGFQLFSFTFVLAVLFPFFD